MNTAITASKLSKIYRLYEQPLDRLREIVDPKSRHREVRALDSIDLTIEQGDRVGLLGVNGSGKSTLLKILSGVLSPTSGSVSVSGKVTALLELGTGFTGELSGLDNIRQFTLLHGMSQREYDAIVDRVVEFAELQSAIRFPLRTYSSGMVMRLGFSCATFVEPEILIVDEALSVGDLYFQNKCVHKIRSLLDRGTTFIYVTHSADAVRSLCKRGILLDQGRKVADADAEAVADLYRSIQFSRFQASSDSPTEPAVVDAVGSIDSSGNIQPAMGFSQSSQFAARTSALRKGSGEVLIADVTIHAGGPAPSETVWFGRTAVIRVFFEVRADLPADASLCVAISDRYGVELVHFDPLDEGVRIANLGKGRHHLDFSFVPTLAPGEYAITCGAAAMSAQRGAAGQRIFETIYDHRVGGSRFEVSAYGVERSVHGKVYLPFEVSSQSYRD